MKFYGVLLCIALAGCGGPSGTASIDWSGQKIRLALSHPSGGLLSKATLTCLSCQTAIPPFPVTPDDRGEVVFDLPDAREQITTRFHLEGGDLDTALILQPPAPEVVSRQYDLPGPLAGRVLVTHLAVVYRDTSMTETVTTLEREDEANIFGENDLYYFVHHPLYNEPLVILRTHAVRIR
jgi:hypothetical protein